MLDVDDLSDADFNVAELTAVGDLTHASKVIWEGAASAFGHVTAGSKALMAASKDLIGTGDLDSALSVALEDVRGLPSPFPA